MQWQYEANTDVKLYMNIKHHLMTLLKDLFFIQSFLKSYDSSVWEAEL